MKIVGDSDLCKSRALHTQTPGQRLVPVHSVLWPLLQRLAESGRSTGSRERTHFASWAPASTETTNSQPAASYQRDALLFVKAMNTSRDAFCSANHTELRACTKSHNGSALKVIIALKNL